MNKLFNEILSEKELRYLWYCNLGIEDVWKNKKLSVFSNYRLRNIEEICIFLARKEDVILCRERPDKNYLSYLSTLNFNIPNFFSLDDITSESLIESVEINRHRIINQLKNEEYIVVPYSYDQNIDRIVEECSLQWLYKVSDVKHFNDKIWINRIMKDNGILCPESFEGHGEDDIANKCKQLFSMTNTGGVVLKKIFGASGKGNYLIKDIRQLKSIMRIFLEDEKNILIEKYYNEAENFSYQIYIQENGNIDVFFISKQIVKGMVYKGTEFGRDVFEEPLKKEIKEEGLNVGSILYKNGIRGIVGVDGIYAGGKIYPSIDVNVRFTMATYLSKITSIIGEEKYFCAIISDVSTYKCFEYEEILLKLEHEKLLYVPEKGSGILVYISGTLPRYKDKKLNKYLGRIYALIVGDSEKHYIELKGKYDRFLGGLGMNEYK